MTKIAIVGDMHFGFKNGDKDFLDFQKSWLADYFLPYCKENGIEDIIQTGDFFDIRKYMPLNVMDMVLNWLPEKLHSNGIKSLSVPAGNHDLFYRDVNTISSVDLLHSIKSNSLKINIAKEKPILLKFGDKKVALLPYLSKDIKDNLLDSLASIVSTNGNVDYLVAHLDVIGMPMMKGHLCEHGVDLETFKSFTRVISGHFHIPSEHKNLTITGAPYILNWGDYSDRTPRGFYVLDTDSDALNFVPNPDFLTLFSVIGYDPEVKYDESTFEPYSGNIVKVLVSKKDNEKHYKNFTKLLNEASFLSFSIIDVSEQKIEKVVISEKTLALNTISAISDYIDKQDNDIDKQGLKELAADIYKEVTNG